MANREPMKAAISASSSFTSGPMMNCWLSRTRPTAARISAFISGVFGLEIEKGEEQRRDFLIVGCALAVSDCISKFNYIDCASSARVSVDRRTAAAWQDSVET